MESGEKDATSWSAYRGSRVGVGETNSFTCETINVWSQQFWMSHVTGLEVSPFIKHEVNDIWLLLIAECSREER